jgi:hypothetical protein
MNDLAFRQRVKRRNVLWARLQQLLVAQVFSTAAILPPELSLVPFSVSVANRKSPKLRTRSPLLDTSDVLC